MSKTESPPTSTDPTQRVKQLESEIVASKVDLASALQNLSALHLQTATAERAGSKALSQHHDAVASAQRDVQVLGRNVSDLETELVPVKAEALVAEQAAAYDVAVKKRKAVEAAILAAAPEINERVAALTAAALEVDTAIQAANANLPAGCKPIELLEHDVRFNPSGKVFYDSAGLGIHKRHLSCYDFEFWMNPAPRSLPYRKPQPPSQPRHVSNAAPEPGAWVAPKFCALPVFPEPPAKNPDASFFEPGRHISIGGR